MKHYHKNPRTITHQQFGDLKKWLAELGDLSGIVHDLNSDEVPGGNMRLEAMGLMDAEPVITDRFDPPTSQGTVARGYYQVNGERFDYRAVRWTPEQCEKANIVANKAGGDWDFDVLANDWELDDLLGWGFSEDELQLNWGSDEPTPDPGAQVDKAAELQEKWKVERGQVWEIPSLSVPGKAHRVMCGDSVNEGDVARLVIVPIEMCFTSPPYNLGGNISISNRSQSMKNHGTVYAGGEDSLSTDQYLAFLSSLTENVLQVAHYLLLNVQMLAGNKVALMEYLYKYRRHLADIAIWHKTNQQPAMAEKVMNSCFEFVVFLCQDDLPSRAIKTGSFRGTFDNLYASTINVNPFADMHGAAFPVELAHRFIVAFSAESCLDVCLGTGTTMVACEQAGRVGYGMEIHPPYVSVSLERLAGMSLEPRLVEQ